MSSYPSAGERRAMAARVCLLLLGWSACAGLAGAATAGQPPASAQTLAADSRLLRKEGETVQVNITGRVMDADSGQPLPAFFLTTGTQDREHTGFDWAEQGRRPCARGEFNVTVTKDKHAPAVMIEADGYLPQCSGPIRELATNLTFLLKKGKGPAGVALTPEGRPAAGCTVYFSRLKDLIFLEGPKMEATNVSARVRSTVTDAAGRFAFAPDLDGYAVVAADDAGFAQERIEALASSPEVHLQRWARVEGTLKIGRQPGANETVRLAAAFAPFTYYPRPVPPCAISAETRTDGAGRFVFPRAPPVDVKIFHTPKMGRVAGLLPMTQITNLSLHGGERRTVTLGGEGRRLVGRAALKNYGTTVDWAEQVFWIDELAPEPADCPNFEAISREYYAGVNAARSQEDKYAVETRYLAEHERIARQLCAYYSGPAGRRYWFSRRRYVLQFAPDGSFRIDDVPGGKYQLSIDLRALEAKKGQLHSPLIAARVQEIDVPEAPGGGEEAPLDLGVINLVAPLNPGEMAPDVAVKTVEGKTIKLSDYKGKYVLLDFWAGSDEPSVEEMPNLKETYAAFKDEPRLAMLGLNLDKDMASARAFSTGNHIGWPQGYVGPWSESQMPTQFGVESLPYVLLIGPDGRVVARGLRGGTIRSTVEAALAARETRERAR